MGKLLFITHPEVIIDPQIDIRRWRLTPAGIARMRQFSGEEARRSIRQIWASTEAKAIEAAGILAAGLGLGINVCEALGENDRSATGFLPPAEFEAVADAFFATPLQSVRGWERAIDAQARVAQAVSHILSQQDGQGDIAIVAHGAVGSLLLSQALKQPISRSLDQPFQGHFWKMEIESGEVLHGWQAIAPR